MSPSEPRCELCKRARKDDEGGWFCFHVEGDKYFWLCSDPKCEPGRPSAVPRERGCA